MIAFVILMILFFVGLDDVDNIDFYYEGRVLVTIVIVYCLQVLIIGVLNMVVLYAYHKMNHKLTERAKKMITHVMRRSSLAD